MSKESQTPSIKVLDINGNKLEINPSVQVGLKENGQNGNGNGEWFTGLTTDSLIKSLQEHSPEALISIFSKDKLPQNIPVKDVTIVEVF